MASLLSPFHFPFLNLVVYFGINLCETHLASFITKGQIIEDMPSERHQQQSARHRKTLG